MVRIFVFVVLSLYLVAPSKAQTGDVQNVIAAQIQAFQIDDFTTAFTYASPMIRGMFGTPERFGAMVQRAFPMVWRPADVKYLQQSERGGLTYQRLLVRDADGAYHSLEYEMLATPEGWRINGVQFLANPAVAA